MKENGEIVEIDLSFLYDTRNGKKRPCINVCL